MDHSEIERFFGLVFVVLTSAKFMGFLARKIGQPAVLGELVAGVVLGTSVLGLLDVHDKVFRLLAELGVVILLFEIGLETDLRKLLRVGGEASMVAVVGVVLPFALGYVVCRFLGWENLVGVVVGASLTATSVGITARVLSDLGHLQDRECQIVLGAAVLDDLLGLVILAVVAGLTQGQEITVWGVVKTTGIAFGFVVVALFVGNLLIPPLTRWVAARSPNVPSLTMLAIMLAIGMAWLAAIAGSATIIGALAAGLLLGKTPQAHDIRHGVAHIGHFFVPIFFVIVGTAVDVRLLNPLNPASQEVLVLTGLLVLVAAIGKWLAGYAPFWFDGKKSVIGLGMIPRGEVGLIFAQMGISSGVFDARIFSAVTLTVMVTTFMAPPLLKHFFPGDWRGQSSGQLEETQELVD